MESGFGYFRVSSRELESGFDNFGPFESDSEHFGSNFECSTAHSSKSAYLGYFELEFESNSEFAVGLAIHPVVSLNFVVEANFVGSVALPTYFEEFQVAEVLC